MILLANVSLEPETVWPNLSGELLQRSMLHLDGSSEIIFFWISSKEIAGWLSVFNFAVVHISVSLFLITCPATTNMMASVRIELN